MMMISIHTMSLNLARTPLPIRGKGKGKGNDPGAAEASLSHSLSPSLLVRKQFKKMFRELITCSPGSRMMMMMKKSAKKCQHCPLHGFGYEV